MYSSVGPSSHIHVGSNGPGLHALDGWLPGCALCHGVFGSGLFWKLLTHILMHDKEVQGYGCAVFYIPLCWLSSTQLPSDSHRNLSHFENTKSLSLRHSFCLLSLLLPLIAAPHETSQ